MLDDRYQHCKAYTVNNKLNNNFAIYLMVARAKKTEL
jgi:hypothetical protein